MTNLLNEGLFDTNLWQAALDKYGSSTHVTVKLFDAAGRSVLGPIHPTPLFELFDGAGYDPGFFTECTKQCLRQIETRPTVIISKVFGLTVFGTSLVLDGEIVGAAVAGYVFVDFSQVSEMHRLAKEAGITFERLWRVAREQKPVPQSRLIVHGELLQVLGDALLRENARTRQYQTVNHALSDSEERYRALFDLGPVAVYSCDDAGVIDNFNRRAAELWGRKPVRGDTDERFCGSFKMFAPDGTFMPHEQCPMAEVVAGKIAEVHDQEVVIERPDGSHVVVVVNIRPLMSQRGEITGAINCFYDITDRKRVEQVLKESRENLERTVESRTIALRELSLSLLRVQDDERRRIARDLHDSVGQYLAHAKMSLAAFRSTDSSERASQAMTELNEDLDTCITETRTISYLLHPPLLDELGLKSAVNWFLDGFSARSGIRVNAQIPPDLGRFPAPVELVLFRVLQESLVNVHRHSHSSSVEIQLNHEAEAITLLVTDHGEGMSQQTVDRFVSNGGGGVGLRSMRGRVEELGGRFEIHSNKDGTSIRVTVPLSEDKSLAASHNS